jgi:hypothetical protein
LARHLTIFGEAAALTESIRWLQELRFKQLESSSGLLEKIRLFVDQPDFLPEGARLGQINSDMVSFIDPDGYELPVELLSDGYRSILSMTFDLIRHMTITYGEDGVFSEDGSRINTSGVVLIDEIDAHLHPTWQHRVGGWLRRHFPNIQFLVTTHSPLVLQAAISGSVMHLPAQGTDEIPTMLTGTEFERLVYGNVLDAFGTGVFGDNVTRSEESQSLRTRLAQLNVKASRETLSELEVQELARLRSVLPSSASDMSPNEN